MPRQRRSTARGTAIEAHPECAAIEADLARGVPLRAIHARWGISPPTACRHRQKMRREQPEVFQALAAADWKVRPDELEQLRTETADGFLKVVRTQVSKLVAAQDKNLEAGNDGTAAVLAAQVHKALDMLGRAVDQLGATSSTTITNNVVLSPAFWEIRTAILRALAPFPDARTAVLHALRHHAQIEDAEPPAMLTIEASPEAVSA
jgi:hypothetical protein